MSDQVSQSLRQAAKMEGAVVVLPKNPLVSKTIIINTIMAVITIAASLMNLELVKENAAWLIPALVSIHTIANYILRIFTLAPLTISPEAGNGNGSSTAHYNFMLFPFFLLACCLSANALIGQEPAAKPSVTKLAPAEEAPRKPARTEAAEETDAPRRTGSGLLSSFRERREQRLARGLTLSNFVKIGKDLEARGEIVKGETPPEEVGAAIVVELQQQSGGSNLAAIDWDFVWDLVERFLPMILDLLGWGV